LKGAAIFHLPLIREIFAALFLYPFIVNFLHGFRGKFRGDSAAD
jgi:hypothetical protein